MCFQVITKKSLVRLVAASRHLIELLNNGTLAQACGPEEADQMTRSVAAFDLLEGATDGVSGEMKEASPFLRFRREILSEAPVQGGLQDLVLALNGTPFHEVNYGHLLTSDAYRARIALDCVAAYSCSGGNDPHFRALVTDISNALLEAA